MSTSRRYNKYDDFDIEHGDRHKKERRRSRSRSRSRSRNRHHRHHDRRTVENRSRSRSRRHSRSRSRSLEERRRQRLKRSSRSRSASRNGSRRERKHTYSRHDHRRSSRSRSRSGSRTHNQAARRNKPRSPSRSPFMQDNHTESANKSPDGSVVKSHKPVANDDCGNSNASTSTTNSQHANLEDLPLPQAKRETPKGAYYNLSTDEPIDKERIHREIEEKLRQALAKEGKVYPPPKQEASHPVFANDGSFLEIFKKMQQQQQHTVQQPIAPVVNNSVMPMAPVVPAIAAAITPKTAPYVAATALGKSAPPPPIVGRRRGGKILKTGVVAKPKPQPENTADPKDFWSLYLAELNKYKTTACESDTGTRPLVK